MDEHNINCEWKGVANVKFKERKLDFKYMQSICKRGKFICASIIYAVAIVLLCLKGNCSTLNKKTPLNLRFAEQILYRIMNM